MDFKKGKKQLYSTIKKRIFVSDNDQYRKLHHIVDKEDIEYSSIISLRSIPCENSIDLFLLSKEFISENSKELNEYYADKNNQPCKIYFIGNDLHITENAEIIDSVISLPISDIYLANKIRSGFQDMQVRLENKLLNEEIFNVNNQISELSHIGQRLMMEKDLGKLLSLILLKSREMASADAGSLYLVEENDNGEKSLRFTLTQNDSVSFEFEEFTMPISRKSISGYVADTGSTLNIEDVYNLPSYSEFSFNKSFDLEVGYRSKSMLVLPLINHMDEVIGVVQLINRKKDWTTKLSDTEITDETVIPFTGDCLNTVTALAGQAAVSIENNLLYRNIELLFEGFVNASVKAIESRDPTTSGHSSRVAILTVNLAKTIDRIDNGILKNVKFSPEQIKEMRYASLLHDFGKVGVREPVLLKSKKLYPYQITDIMHRLGHQKRYEEICSLKAKLKFLLEQGFENHQAEFGRIEKELKERIKEINETSDLILAVNEPTVLESDAAKNLEAVSDMTYVDPADKEHSLLKLEEKNALFIKRGSLDENERLEIESHVQHTYQFLKKVPWTKDIMNVPEIAYAHHEKLDGSGYPNNINKPSIPVQSRMMTISDIFDALTASDRPYKKAVPYKKALDILHYETIERKIDSDLLEVFVESGIYRSVLPEFKSGENIS